MIGCGLSRAQKSQSPVAWGLGESGKDCGEREREERNPELRMKPGRKGRREEAGSDGGGRGREKRDPERQVKAGGRGVGGRAGFRDAIERRIWRKGKGAKERKEAHVREGKREGDGSQGK